MRKLMLTLLAFLLLCITGCGIQKETPADEFSYKMDDGEIIITGYLGTERKIVVPKEINDRPVTQIGEGAFSEYDLIEIVFPEGLRIIGEQAFEDCACLEAITFPESLETIDDFAFRHCKVLEKVELPNDLSYLGWEAFYGCEKLKEVELPDSFTGFRIEKQSFMFEGNLYWGKRIWSPINGETVFVVKENSAAHTTILEYGYDSVNYIIK